MNKKILKLFIFLVVVSLSTPIALATYCNGGFAHIFEGTLKINGENASVGTIMRATIEGDVKGEYTTTLSGKYGYLIVSGDSEGYDNPPLINFEVYINEEWVDSGENFVYLCGGVDSLDIDILYDSDRDGFTDDIDKCPDTTYEEPFEPIIFGCSCKQILELKPGKVERSCNKGVMDVITRQIGWAKDLFKP